VVEEAEKRDLFDGKAQKSGACGGTRRFRYRAGQARHPGGGGAGHFSIPVVLPRFTFDSASGGVSTWLFGDGTDNVIAHALISVFDEMSHQSQPCGILFEEL
jgi:hypothetical protein